MDNQKNWITQIVHKFSSYVKIELKQKHSFFTKTEIGKTISHLILQLITVWKQHTATEESGLFKL